MTPTTRVKIAEIFDKLILDRLEDWRELLLTGELSSTEEHLQELLLDLYNAIMGHLLREVGSSLALKERLRVLGLSLGLSCLKLRPTRLQISSGHWVEYKSYYAHEVSKESGQYNRQLSHVYWGCVERASPRYMSMVAMMSVVSPSFELGGQYWIIKASNIITRE